MRWRRTWWSGAREALWKFVFGTALIDILRLLQKGDKTIEEVQYGCQ
ncbi:unnamed protein product [Rhodiola kirilowii]